MIMNHDYESAISDLSVLMTKIDVTRPSNFHQVLKNCVLYSLRKTVGTDSGYVTSSSDSNFERSNISLKENIPDGVDPNSDGHDYCIRENEGKILWFSTKYFHALSERTKEIGMFTGYIPHVTTLKEKGE